MLRATLVNTLECHRDHMSESNLIVDRTVKVTVRTAGICVKFTSTVKRFDIRCKQNAIDNFTLHFYNFFMMKSQNQKAFT